MSLLEKYRSEHPEVVRTSEAGTPLWRVEIVADKQVKYDVVTLLWCRGRGEGSASKPPIPLKALRSVSSRRGERLLEPGQVSLHRRVRVGAARVRGVPSPLGRGEAQPHHRHHPVHLVPDVFDRADREHAGGGDRKGTQPQHQWGRVGMCVRWRPEASRGRPGVMMVNYLSGSGGQGGIMTCRSFLPPL